MRNEQSERISRPLSAFHGALSSSQSGPVGLLASFSVRKNGAKWSPWIGLSPVQRRIPPRLFTLCGRSVLALSQVGSEKLPYFHSEDLGIPTVRG
jgi:hypothetical protein